MSCQIAVLRRMQLDSNFLNIRQEGTFALKILQNVRPRILYNSQFSSFDISTVYQKKKSDEQANRQIDKQANRIKRQDKSTNRQTKNG